MTAPWINLFNGTKVTVPESALRRHRWRRFGRLGLLAGLSPGPADDLPLHVDIGEASWRPGESLASLLGCAGASMYAHKAAARALRTSPLESGTHPSGGPLPLAQLAGSA